MTTIKEGDECLLDNPQLTKELSQVPSEVQPPMEAYMYFPPKEERILTIGNHTQRLIFEGGQKYEDYEWDYIRAFEQYLEDNQIEVSGALDSIIKEPR